MQRRTFLPALAAPALAASPTPRKGRLKQSVCKWCYKNISVEELAREASRIGLVGIDLIGPADWPAARKYGLIPTMAPGAGTIADALNRKENHAEMERQFRGNLDLAARHGVPNVITFSGNRRGMSDDEGLDNCALILNRVKAIAEDKGVTICMELLNSKVNHADYMCDKTPWGVELVKRVNSPRFRLLYDIYHMQIMEGDVIRTIRDNFQYIAHYHTGGNPGRNEIDETQELNYKAIAQAIVDLGFTGYFAHEFIPKRDPMRSLAEATALCDV
ncbi:MAG: TIM barrel protein [Bryobacterales bacterium]|nr:TIM barrel protein [Bryobacterales bacterium]